jgi:type II secretory pathway pseudopilin PulG
MLSIYETHYSYMKKYKQKGIGFALIELLIIISIIGILSALSIIFLNNARAKSRDKERISDIRQIQSALESYASSQKGYPVASRIILGNGAASVLSQNNGFSGLIEGKVYIEKIPTNPLPGGEDYIYSSYTSSSATTLCNTAPCPWYVITFSLERQTGGFSEGTRIADPNGIF